MPYLSLPTLGEYTHAKWELALTSGGVELDIDLISASFNINNGDVNNPFNLNCNNTANITIENDLDLVKGQEIVFIAYKLDANGDRTQTTINLGTYYVDNGNFDEYQNKYDFVSAENKYNINCPYIDFTNPYIVDQDKQSLNFAKLVNLEFTTAGFTAPLDVALESVGIEVSTDKNFVDYTQYTLISLLNMYNSFYCNVQDGFDGQTSEELALPYDLASAGSPQKSYGDTSGIDFVNIKFKYVTSATELIPASEEDGTDAHNVITRQTADGSYYFNTQQQSETPIQGNGFTIEFPFPVGSANVSGADNAHSVLNSYSVGNMEHFLTAFANAYYPTASIGYVLSPEVYNRLNHNIMMYDVSAIDSETLANHLVDGYYQFDLDNPDDVALIQDITYPFTMMFMQYSISFDGSASISISSGNAWNVSSMSSSASSGSVSIIADASGNNVAQVMAMLGRIENRVKWWDKNGLNLNNFGSILANADYLNMGSKLFQDIQATTITTDYLKASEGNIDWLTVLNATIETAMIKDGAITHAKIGTEAVEASNIKDATITGAQIANSTITNANIANVSADKLTAGTIYTNNVTIQSQEGNFLISDNTLQIKDNNDTVRVQIGQTGASEPYDYDLILQDASGNIMWNASGLQENGVPNGLIKDVMVANNAAIQAGKLDIDSLFTVINNDNTNVIYGSKIYMNDEQASLSVVLSEIRSQIGDGSGEFYMNLTQPPTLYNYPANSWGEGGGSLYPDDYLYPSSNTYPDIEMYMGNVPYPSQYLYPNANGGGGSSSYQDHLGAKAYMTDSQGRVRSWMFDQDEQGNYYWRETTGTLDDVILQRLAVVEINTTEFESRFSEMGVTQDGIYNFWSMFHQDSSHIIQEVANERLISAINQTAEQVSINASKISLEGLVTVNGKFTIDRYGSMTATGGKIADFTITNNAIYNGTDSNTSTTKGVYVGKDGIRQYENANAYVDIKNGVLTAQGVSVSGSINMTSGTINIETQDSSETHTSSYIVFKNEYRYFDNQEWVTQKSEYKNSSWGYHGKSKVYNDYSQVPKYNYNTVDIWDSEIQFQEYTPQSELIKSSYLTSSELFINQYDTSTGNLYRNVQLDYAAIWFTSYDQQNGNKTSRLDSNSLSTSNVFADTLYENHVSLGNKYATISFVNNSLNNYVTQTELSNELDYYYLKSNIKNTRNVSVSVTANTWTYIGNIESLVGSITGNTLVVIKITNLISPAVSPTGIHVQKYDPYSDYRTTGVYGHIECSSSSSAYNDELTLVYMASTRESNALYVRYDNGTVAEVIISTITLS